MKVGIGTTSSSTNLHIVGTSPASSSSHGGYFQIGHESSRAFSNG